MGGGWKHGRAHFLSLTHTKPTQAPVTDARSRFADPPPPDARAGPIGRGGGIPLPDPGPGGGEYFSAWGGRAGSQAPPTPVDPYYGEAPSSSYGGAYGSAGEYGGGPGESFYGGGGGADDPSAFY
jgi:hypothetical protein